MVTLNAHVPSQAITPESPPGAIQRLVEFVKKEREQKPGVGDFARFEQALHDHVMALEREIVAEELARADVDAEAVEIDGVSFRRAVRSVGQYQTAAGVVEVERTLYRSRRKGTEGRSFAALDRNVGIVEGRWTPMAAMQATWVVTHLTPSQGEDLLQRLGNMTPSKSSLQRLPKQLLGEQQTDREGFEEVLRQDEHVPDEAVTVSVSLDGVMAPMRDGAAQSKRQDTANSGQLTRGPAGYREVGCGTLSFYDNDGQVLRTVRIGRMPEFKKETLKSMLKAELGRALAERPELRLVALADGASDNWSYLQDDVLANLPDDALGVAILDFFHAAEHVSAAFGAAYGEGTVKARSKFDEYRRILLEDPKGVDKTIAALSRLSKRMPRNAKLASVVRYLRTHRRMMRYADYREAGLPIGSGIMEAACKTLVTQRMKHSGMRWSPQGGQAILDLRSWAQSDRFDRAWALIAARYRVRVHTLANVISLPTAL